MKHSRLHILAIVGAAALVSLGFGVRAWQRRGEAASKWARAQPAAPDLANWPAAFRDRMRAIEAQLQNTPRDLAALGELAQLYHANGFLNEAEQAYRGLLVFDPVNGRWPHLLASLLAGYGRLEEASGLFERAVRLAPDYAVARLRWADALLKASRWPEAEAAYRAVLDRSPADPYAWLGLARVDLATERLTAAREKLSRAIAVDSKFFAAHSLLASVFERLGNDEAAALARARASQAGRYREPPDPWVSELMTFCYDAYRLQVAAATAKAAGEPRVAVQLLERAISFAPDDARSRRQLGVCLVALRELAPARVQLERAVALAPGEPAAYQDLAQVVLAQSSPADALSILARALERCADKGGLHHQSAVMLLMMQRKEEAAPHLRAAMQLNPEKPEVACDLVRALFELGRDAEAAAVLEEALVQHPEFGGVLVLGARRAVNLGDMSSAARLIGRANRAGAAPAELDVLEVEFRKKFGRAP